MMGIPLAFTVPLVLVGLMALPILYWLLRLTPPPPRVETLPTLPLLRDLEPQEQTPAHTPWWLLLLRLLLAALIIIAMAGPLWNPETSAHRQSGPLLVVIDNGWPSAPDWKQRVARAQGLIEQAGAEGRPVALRATADEPADVVPIAASRALETLRSLNPVPHTVDRQRHGASLRSFLERQTTAGFAWINDGISTEASDDTLSSLAATFADRMAIYAAEAPRQTAVTGVTNAPDALSVRVIRASDAAPAAGALRASDSRGRGVAETRYLFANGARETVARFEIPLELRNEISRIDLVGESSAGAVALLDSRSKRRRVGIINGESADTVQPLLSQSYFLGRALGPFADVREAPRGASDPVTRLIEDGVGVIILVESGALTGSNLQSLTRFVEDGGVLIRFASRRASIPTDTLVPVRLRRSERVMGGALSWDRPRRLASFPVGSPFEGLRVPGDVTVSQQILAEPDSGLAQRTWAALEDGTPLITGDRRGKGVTVLYHVTADTGWSSLPFSGAFVETLRRLLTLGADMTEPHTLTGQESSARTALPPVRTLDAFGVFRSPPPTAEALPRSYSDPANARHPPGFYGTPDAPLAINVLAPQATVAPVATGAATKIALDARQPQDVRPWLLVLAVMLFMGDAVVRLLGSGALMNRRTWVPVRRALVLLGLALPILALMSPSSLHAQPAAGADRIPSFRADDVEAALTTRLAFVITGDREVDEVSRQGLQGLSRALSTRTALDPGEPIGVDIARDELSFYPLLYWPMVASRPAPPLAAIRRVEAFMRNGGTVIFDTRDALSNRTGGSVTPETRLMREILSGITVPDLEPIPKDHVVTKTFYILDGFVGRYATGRSWIEVLQRNAEQDRTRPAQAGDRVSPILITSNDLAAAWAIDRTGQPRFPLVPGDARQRELAIRGGINIVMYALTGNYKADQVHVPALLERLGQ